MYVPENFAETDRETQLAVIRETGWGYLVGVIDDLPYVTHLPFMVDGAAGREKLVAHVSRLNPHWNSFAEGREQLVVFPGPHGYVSPSWYKAKKAVPTWNYVAVHVYGTPRIVDDPEACYAAQKNLVDFHESGLEQPWRMEDMPESYIDGMLRGIVGFEIPIARIEAKFKLNQNRKPEDRKGVIAAFAAGEREDSRRLAELMAARETAD
jgi:transcriptional regulator